MGRKVMLLEDVYDKRWSDLPYHPERNSINVGLKESGITAKLIKFIDEGEQALLELEDGTIKLILIRYIKFIKKDKKYDKPNSEIVNYKNCECEFTNEEYINKSHYKLINNIPYCTKCGMGWIVYPDGHKG